MGTEAMSDEAHDERVRRLFANITAKLEDAAALAVEGQATGQPATAQINRAGQVEQIVRDVQRLAQAVGAVRDDRG